MLNYYLKITRTNKSQVKMTFHGLRRVYHSHKFLTFLVSTI